MYSNLGTSGTKLIRRVLKVNGSLRKTSCKGTYSIFGEVSAETNQKYDYPFNDDGTWLFVADETKTANEKGTGLLGLNTTS